MTPTPGNNLLNCLELFCGAGGLTRGLEDTGRFRTVAANDVWLPACATYKANFPHVHFIQGSITEPDIKRQIVAAFAGIRCHVICGGPPCQSFSLSGRRDTNDPRARLFEDYLDMVGQLRPIACLMENVVGILSMRLDGKLVTDHIRQGFTRRKYDLAFRVIDASAVGLPQRRERLIFIATQKGMTPIFPYPTHGVTRNTSQ